MSSLIQKCNHVNLGGFFPFLTANMSSLAHYFFWVMQNTCARAGKTF